MKNETGSEPKFKTKTSAAHEPALYELFLDSIMDIFWAEIHLVKNLPKMIEASSSPKLKEAIQNHLEQTKIQVTRLEKVFELLGEIVLAKKCDAMEGLAKEGEGIVESTEAGTATRDIGVIMASQKIEHYEIATYAGLVQLAKTLGYEDAATLFQQTLDEEKQADQLLAEVAAGDLSSKASQE